MTIEEIIHAMRKNKTCAFYDSDGYEDEINLLFEKDMNIIIDALEKQIPKKNRTMIMKMGCMKKNTVLIVIRVYSKMNIIVNVGKQ